MHKCLSISEVVSRVCLQLVCDVPYASNGQYPGTLAAFAATCRAISEPALDTLWHTQSTIAPLLRCMPSDLWEGAEAEAAGSPLHLCRPIVSTDWYRLQIYAPRIKVIASDTGYKMWPNFNPQVLAEALLALSNSKPTPAAPLCPNIRSLDWGHLVGENHEISPYIRLFLGPHTKHLALTVYDADFTWLSIIHSLPRDYPGITDITFDWMIDQCSDVISDTVCQWNRLESFTWNGDLSYRAFVHLAGLPTLRKIDMSIPNLSGYRQGHLSTLQRPAFRALRSALVSCQNFSSCTSLIEITPSYLELDSITVRIEDEDDHEASIVGYFLQTLNGRCSHTALTVLELNDSHGWPTHFSDEHVISDDMFRPLLAFTNMAELTIYTPHAFRLGNGILRDIAASWIQLRWLKLGTLCGWAGQSQITLAGLIPLLSLPKLEGLNIVINASSVDYTLDMPPTGLSNTKITRLILADSVIQSAHSVAAFLSDVLPNVRQIHSWNDAVAQNASVSPADAKKYRVRWLEVATLIETIAKVRKQERSSVREHINASGTT